jgi:hypothetical protein
MEIIKATNGFPYAWKAGRVEKLIRSILEDKAREQLNAERVMIVNPTWLHENNLSEDIVQANPDFIICHNFVDPAVPKIFDAVEQSGKPYVILGNSGQYRLDFWAMVCDLYFQHYEEDNVALRPDSRKFICLNRKPHPHRRVIVDQLLPLREQGFISLGLPGESAITVDTEFTDDQGIRDEYQYLGTDESFVSRKIRNDIFSLGDINNWNRSLLCIVTETEFNNYNQNNFFISEKTWKPVIGMRPFFVYGQPKLREYLKAEGFDIFEDVFDYSTIHDQAPDPYQQRQYAQVAINAINNLTDPYRFYQNNFHRLQHNKQLFHSYVYKQWQRLERLNLNEFV